MAKQPIPSATLTKGNGTTDQGMVSFTCSHEGEEFLTVTKANENRKGEAQTVVLKIPDSVEHDAMIQTLSDDLYEAGVKHEVTEHPRNNIITVDRGGADSNFQALAEFLANQKTNIASESEAITILARGDVPAGALPDMAQKDAKQFRNQAPESYSAQTTFLNFLNSSETRASDVVAVHDAIREFQGQVPGYAAKTQATTPLTTSVTIDSRRL